MSFDGWFLDRLSYFMGFESPEMLDFVKSMPSSEVKDYLSGFLPPGAETDKFVSEVLSRKPAVAAPRAAATVTSSKPITKSTPAPSTDKRKGKDERKVDDGMLVAETGKKSKGKEKYPKESAPAVPASKPAPVILNSTAPEFVPTTSAVAFTSAPAGPQRPQRACNCYATAHELYANCTSCGKIVCAAEGGDICGFCEAPLPDDVRHSAVLDNKLSAAVEHKDTLLLYDRTSAARTQVFDDQADYFQDTGSAWLNDEEQRLAREKAAARRARLLTRPRQLRLQLDFAGRAVIVRDLDAEEEQEKMATVLKAATAAPRGRKLDSAPVATGLPDDGPAATTDHLVGGYYANPTLSGRAAEIYASILTAPSRVSVPHG